jgi:hypothetical protein
MGKVSGGLVGGGLAGVIVAFSIVVALTGSPARGAVVTREILKTYFEKGDVPTQSQFGTLIDSMVNYTEDRYLLGLRVYDPAKQYLAGDTVAIKRFGIGDTTPAGPLGIDYADPHVNPVQLEPDFAGQFGFAAVKLGDSAGHVFYGYLQIQMDAAGGGGAGGATGPITSLNPPGPAINVQYIVFNDTPNTPVNMVAVPEPASAALLACFAAGLLRRQRMR